MENIKRYLKDEWKDKKKKGNFDVSEFEEVWSCDDVTVPLQNNHDDCGLFVMVYTYFICKSYRFGMERGDAEMATFGVGFNFQFE